MDLRNVTLGIYLPLTQNLIKDLIQPGYKGHRSLHDSLPLLIKHIHGLSGLLHRAHIGIRTQQDMLELGLTLVDTLHRLLVWRGTGEDLVQSG